MMNDVEDGALRRVHVAATEAAMMKGPDDGRRSTSKSIAVEEV